jgi:ubiquinone/menaquinone biosynthesis C-methylase UbiE
MSEPQKVDYGVDAPGVVRNLVLIGAAGLAVWASVWLHLWSGEIILNVAGTGLGAGILCIVMSLWMLWDSKIGKLRSRERLLDRISWTGAEQVLDVGCGRGLMLIGAARRLRNGTATGIDVWQSEDLSGNRADALLENVRRSGLTQHIHVETADMRRMPFAAESFDVIVSRAAIHNLYQPAERAQALSEIIRVLKPGGYVLIDDIRHIGEYAANFTRAGCGDVRRYGSPVTAALLAVLTFGSLCPGNLVVRKNS